MPRELITVQVGQCGIQLGTRFWDLALREHASVSREAVFDEPMSSFFRNVERGAELAVGDGRQPIRTLKARAVLVDMEEGVLSEVMRSPLAELFDRHQFVRDVSGSGNNWAHGHEVYGPQYRDTILEQVRRATECCDSLQSFFLMHSLGGGTGSGLGTYVTEALRDQYPETYRFTTAVFPSEADDVITSPYNSVLSLSRLVEHADCVLAVENEALERLAPNVRGGPGAGGRRARKEEAKRDGDIGGGGGGGGGGSFDDMNTVAAHVLTNLTCGMRFAGNLNVDINEVTMNLVPFPGLHFLVPGVSPLQSLAREKPRRGAAPSRGIDSAFSDAFARENQLLCVDPRNDTYLACALLARGDIQVSDLNRNIERLKPSVRLIHWNEDGFKVGLCAAPPVAHPRSVMSVANSCCMRDVFGRMRSRFNRLYKRRAHLHHYTEYMEPDALGQAAETVSGVIDAYDALRQARPPPAPSRMEPVI